MKAAHALALALLLPCPAMAERAKSPADATVFVRVVGSLHAEIEELGIVQTMDRDHVEIGTGSAFIISPYGYVLTNHHVISDRELTGITRGGQRARVRLKVSSIEVCFPRGSAGAGPSSQCSEASVTASDPEKDLAVLFVSGTSLPYAALGDSDAVATGLPVDALGYPFGREVEVGKMATASDIVPEITTTAGTVSALRTDDAGERRYLQISNSVNPGNSGGPVVDRDGFVVGVIRMRLEKGTGIAFAIPVNDVKEFLDSHGVGHLMPTRRLRLQPYQRIEAKRLGLRLLEGTADTSPFMLHVEGDARPNDVALRIDRVVSPWTSRQLEQSLVGSDGFERASMTTQAAPVSTRSDNASLLIGRATGTSADGRSEIAMDYAILDLGAEKLVARYIGPLEQMAFNASVFRESLASLDGQPFLPPEGGSAQGVNWGAAPDAVRPVPLPQGWIVEPGRPSTCGGLPEPGSAVSAFAPHDFTVVLRTAVWSSRDIVPGRAASACSRRRGSLDEASYASAAQWLGVSYLIEGVFLRVGPQQVVQLEVLSPDSKSDQARALLAEWMKKTTAGRGSEAEAGR